MRVSHTQQQTLNRIARGDRSPDGPPDDREPLTVVTYQHSRDGDNILAHRTVLRDDATGNPRTDYRTEMFRLLSDGTLRRL